MCDRAVGFACYRNCNSRLFIEDVIGFSLVITVMRRELGKRWSPKQFQSEIQFPFRVTKQTSRSHMPSKPSKLPIGLWVGALRYLKSI